MSGQLRTFAMFIVEVFLTEHWGRCLAFCRLSPSPSLLSLVLKSDGTSAQAPIYPRVSPHHLILQLLQWHVQAHLFSSSVLTCLQVKRGRQLTKSAQNFVCTSDLRGERGAEGEQLSSRVGHIMSHLKSFNLDVRSLTELFVPALCLSVHRVG